eukprot:SAG31_NODE_3064_length_4732_cov_4.692833_6_plen_226_part_00
MRARGGSDMNTMTLNQWTLFCEECGVMVNGLSRAVLDRIFLRANMDRSHRFTDKHVSELSGRKLNDENGNRPDSKLTLLEFVAALTRVACAMYSDVSLASRVSRFVETSILGSSGEYGNNRAVKDLMDTGSVNAIFVDCKPILEIAFQVAASVSACIPMISCSSPKVVMTSNRLPCLQCKRSTFSHVGFRSARTCASTTVLLPHVTCSHSLMGWFGILGPWTYKV